MQNAPLSMALWGKFCINMDYKPLKVQELHFLIPLHHIIIHNRVFCYTPFALHTSKRITIMPFL